MRVRLLPSGREFTVSGSETVLEGALHAGLALDYGCVNGNCGLCKARLVSGRVEKVRVHDYVLTEAEKLGGHFLMCSNRPLEDVVIEAREAGAAEDVPVQQLAARVRKIDRASDDVIVLHVQTPRTQTLRFLAGQYATLALADLPPAAYSIASCPCDSRNLEFNIERDPGSPFAERVHRGVAAGELVRLVGPMGRFLLREEAARPMMFIACDTGFGPIKSLIEHAIALDLSRPIHLYWLAQPPHGHYFNNLCRSWVDALDDFEYTRLARPEATGETVRALNAAQVDALAAHIAGEHADLSGWDIYIAGGEPDAPAIAMALSARGALATRIAVERCPPAGDAR